MLKELSWFKFYKWWSLNFWNLENINTFCVLRKETRNYKLFRNKFPLLRIKVKVKPVLLLTFFSSELIWKVNIIHKKCWKNLKCMQERVLCAEIPRRHSFIPRRHFLLRGNVAVVWVFCVVKWHVSKKITFMWKTGSYTKLYLYQ